MRPFRHNPDQAWIERQFEEEKLGVRTVTVTVERSRASGRLTIFSVAVQTALDAARFGWALGAPVDALRPWLVQAGDWAGEAIERGLVLDGALAQKWLAVALVAGDSPLAERIARMVPDQVEGQARRDPVAREFLIALSALTTGDLDAAAAAAAAANEAAQGPGASPETVEAYEGLADLAAAVASSDQGAFDRALAGRTEAVVRQLKRSAEARRNREGLLDLRAAAVAAIAHRVGLKLPADNSYIGTELIQAAG